MRYRRFLNLEVPGSYKVKTIKKDGTVLTDTSYATASQIDTDYMWDVVVPGYHKLSAMGKVFNNPMERRTYSSLGGLGSRTAVTETAQSTAIGTIVQFLCQIDGVGHLPNLVDTGGGNALLSAWAAVDKTPYSFGEDLAELKETLEYLKKPLNSFYKLLKPYRRKRDTLMRKGLSKAKAHSQAWLEYRFALVPLASSAYQAGEAIANWRKHVVPKRRTARGYHRSTYQKDTLQTVGYREYVHNIVGLCSTRATVVYEQPGGELSVRARLGLRSKDIPATMWEVCPYSWLIDRFVDIDSLVKAYVNLFDPSIKYLLACTTQTIESTSRVNIQSDTTPGWAVSHSVSPWEVKDKRVTRVPQPTNSVPLPEITGASLSSLVNLTDIMALILQRLR